LQACPNPVCAFSVLLLRENRLVERFMRSGEDGDARIHVHPYVHRKVFAGAPVSGRGGGVVPDTRAARSSSTTFLSSLARALSFLAVGVVLLLAGFFYQRISDQLDERDRRGSSREPPGSVPA
jgi:hypothetical protein